MPPHFEVQSQKARYLQFSFRRQSGIQKCFLSLKTFRIYSELVLVCVLQDTSINSGLIAGSAPAFWITWITDSAFKIVHNFIRQKGFQWVNKIKHAIIWIMLFKGPVALQFDTAMLAGYINYVNDDHRKCSKRVELSRFVAWLTSMSAPFPPHAIMALEDKWVAQPVMTHNVMACPLQWAKPIFSYCVGSRIRIGTPQAIYSRVQQAKGMWRANVFSDFHYVSFHSNSFSIGP